MTDARGAADAQGAAGEPGGLGAHELIDIPVTGGALRVAIWRRERLARRVIVAVHGITANHTAWLELASAVPDAAIVAPDLRGRGGSAALPGPYTLAHHAADVSAVLDTLDLRNLTLVGHSMGAFVSVRVAAARPDRVAELVLVDGGLPLPPAPGLSPEESTAAILGPALDRLRMTFADGEAYRDYWRALPAFSHGWSAAIQAYVDYDLGGEEPKLQPRSNPEAVAVNASELSGSAEHVRALESLADAPVTFLRAPRGLSDADPLYAASVIAEWRARLPGWSFIEVDDVNHYTIVMTPRGAETLAGRLFTHPDAPLAPA
jgi:pimeloyl-ACP methyl ester carboxylesterase